MDVPFLLYTRMNKKIKNFYYYSRLNGNKGVMKQLSIDRDYII